jgi:hypothetical protein
MTSTSKLDATLGRGGDLLDGVGGQVGQLDSLEVGPQRLDRVQHRLAAVGGQPVPQQGRRLPAERPAQLVQSADQGIGVVGIDLVVEGE